MSVLRAALCSSAFVLGTLGLIGAGNAAGGKTGMANRHAVGSAPVRGVCVAGRLKFVSSDTSQSTSSTTPVNVANATVGLALANKGCVVVDFTADPFAANGALLQVQAVLDGTPMSPGLIQLSGDDDENGNGEWSRAHSYSFVAADVPAGSHTVQVQYLSHFGDTVYLNNYTMVVRYQ